ncbi:MAG TPA: DNA internalization-related competence protein ComEC/Rec2 [Gammaproteobacteria bacterium]|nr:DNA internalization-related competence protein ComEC/Rec2 [Gammaproteobacteria bacterium]
MQVLAFLVGIVAAFFLADLPSVYWLLLLPALMPAWYFYPKWRVVLLLPIGFLWALLHAHYVLWSALPHALEGQDLTVIGIVDSLPEKTDKHSRFVLQVEQLIHNQQPQTQYPKKIRLSWFGKISSTVKAGEKWQFVVRLKQPHGMRNPGGFDYEKWLFERKIRATGYVKKSPLNRRLTQSSAFSLNAYRERLKNRISELLPTADYRGIVLALTLGDKTEISDQQWQVFRATGTNHLVAISGLHIGLVAAAVFFVCGTIVRRIPRLLIYAPYYKVAAIAAMLAAGFYAMLAGFAIPTQRALVMICVVMVFMLFNRRLNPRMILSSALFVVLLIDPFSALSAGFWLSFVAVAAILYAMQSRVSANSLWWKWGRIQWITSVALIPVLLFSFQSFSLISPIANIIAVPWVSFLVVPLVLLGALLQFVTPVAQFLFMLANKLLAGLWLVLDYLAHLPFAQWEQFSPQAWTLLPGLIGVLLLLSPKGMPAKYLSVIFLLPLFLIKPTAPANGTFKLTLLDVGQGLSAVVQTHSHVLVFDTGPAFSSGFDTGAAVVLPYLRKNNITRLDMLLVSHGDNDHIGGMQSILDGVEVSQVLTSVPQQMTRNEYAICRAGEQWQWDNVHFKMLNPVSLKSFGKSRKAGNNLSCVLKVSIGKYSILLTGDIEKKAEKRLLKRVYDELAVDVLVAPHHGSNTSSSKRFIKHVDPKFVLYPVGYRNRYGFPKEKVVQRYAQQGVKQISTAQAGAITFSIDASGVSDPDLYRQLNKRIWHH